MSFDVTSSPVIKDDHALEPASQRNTRKFLRSAIKRNPAALIGSVILVALVLLALVGPLRSPYSATVPVDNGLLNAFAAPNAQHWLGLDGQGRDELSRLVAGTRLTLLIAVSAVGVGAIVGTIVGAVAGTAGRGVDGLIMRGIDLLLSFPSLLLALGIVAVFGQGRLQVIFAVGVTTVPVFARLVYGEVHRQVDMDYVHAARMYGASTSRILFRHLVPNSSHLILVQATLLLSSSVVEVAALGYLGLGPADASQAEWGSMLVEATQTLRSQPQLVLWPALALVVTAVATNLLGDGLQKAIEE